MIAATSNAQPAAMPAIVGTERALLEEVEDVDAAAPEAAVVEVDGRDVGAPVAVARGAVASGLSDVVGRSSSAHRVL